MNNRTKKLNQKNNLLDAKISDENQEIFTNIICYLRGSNISEYEIELVRQDLTEMVLSAQNRGESITSLFNGDYKQFCDDVIENSSPKTRKQKIIDSIDSICWVLSILFAISIVIAKDTITIMKALAKNSTVNWNISVSIGSVVSIILIVILANVIVNQIAKSAFSKEIEHKKILGFVAMTGFILALIVIGWLGTKTLFTVNFFVACTVTMILFVIHKQLQNIQ